MKILTVIWLFLLLAFINFECAWAQGDAKNGEKLAATCVACHGAQGISANPIWPSIAGQNEAYFVKQLVDFKPGQKNGRDNPIMAGIVANLNEKDMRDLAAYFAPLKVPPRTQIPLANASDLALGRNIYLGGIRKQRIPACSACHAPQGEGNVPAGFPALASQPNLYTMVQLTNFKNGQRHNDIKAIMRTIAARMSDKEIQAVAIFVEGLGT